MHSTTGRRGEIIPAGGDHAAQAEKARVFRAPHERPGAFVIPDPLDAGDNRCVLHRATPFDATGHQRLMQRTTVSGDPHERAPSGVAVADGRLL